MAKAINRHPVLRPLQKVRCLLTLIVLVLVMVALALGLGLGLGLHHGHGKRHASSYCSDSSGKYQLESITAPVEGYGDPGPTAHTWNLTIDDTVSGYKQIIKGFGATVTDATVASFNNQTNSTLDKLLNYLLTDDGANFSLMRHTIGSSDLSPVTYTYDDNNGKEDKDLSAFSLGDHGTAMAKLLAQMKEVNPDIQIVGSSWSAPAWMKLNGNLAEDSSNNHLNDGWFTSGGVGSTGYSDSFAQYFVKYIQAYQDLGVEIDAITIQNEPLNTQAGYPTMYVYANESARLIGDHVGPALTSAGLNTTVWAFDDNTGLYIQPSVFSPAIG
jgi:O-glycosyl hydrolase